MSYKIHWCVVHDREATEQRSDGKWKCDSKLGGIMMPCKTTICYPFRIKINPEYKSAPYSATFLEFKRNDH